ncbi:MAG: acetylglutamate kinase [Succinivibrio sp.]|nr:acetylglutamate kinase [Succinivibrio sp.]
MDDITVVKLSGKALSGTAELSRLFSRSLGHKLVLVHGGGVEVDSLFEALKLKVEKREGLRVSPREQMPYISAALSGMCGKKLQGLAVGSGLNAVSLLCTDGHTLKVSLKDPALGMVGSVEPSEADFLVNLLRAGVTPLLCSLGLDAQGQLYNINADDVAEAVAVLLHAPLYLISDVKGVLDAKGQLLESLDEQSCEDLIRTGVITEGMAVKVRSALRASRLIKKPVYIASYRDEQLADRIFSGQGVGTAFEP